MLEELQNKIIACWLRKVFLKFLARKHKEYFRELLNDIDIDSKSYRLMIERYINKKSFKELPSILYIEERQVYRLHKQVIDKLVSLRFTK